MKQINSKRILAIDPGTEQSAYMCYYDKELVEFAIVDNETLRHIIPQFTADYCAIEMVAHYGMAVGKEVFETCVWIGRFAEKWESVHKEKTIFIYRKEVTMHLCHSARAKDPNVRQAILDMFPCTGGGKTPQKGTKKQPGPLYGISKDVWSALAVAITCEETKLG